MNTSNNIQFNRNGFIVKRLDSNYGKRFKGYSGIEGEVWPIYKDTENINKEKSEYLYKYVNDNFLTSNFNCDIVDVCNDINFLNEYVQTCLEASFKIDILFCESQKTRPSIDINFNSNDYEFLGFDYGYRGGDYYSCVYNDVKRIPEMSHLMLNKVGLFDSEQEILDFVELRNKLKSEMANEMFESGDDYTIYRLWRYIGGFSIKM